MEPTISSPAALLYDSISPNTGDIAIGIAGQQVFDRLGFGTRIADPFEDEPDTGLIVGGGELIRTTGDAFYDRFRPRGRHILNAAGVWTTADDLDYLREYAVVSARSSVEAEVLGRAVDDVRVLPCATTLLESPTYTIEGVEPGEPLVGIHVVPHSLRQIEDLIPIIDAIPYRKVFIPFTHYNGDQSFMRALPFDRSNTVDLPQLSPLELHSVLGQMSSVLVTSLHASIFAYSQNVPFVSIHQKKVGYYFADRGLEDFVVRTDAELRTAIDRIEHERPDFSSLISRDRAAVTDAFAEYAEIANVAPRAESVASHELSPASAEHRRQLLQQQALHVLGDRDLAIGYSETRRLHGLDREALLQRQLDEVSAEIEEMRMLRRHRYPEGARKRLQKLFGRA